MNIFRHRLFAIIRRSVCVYVAQVIVLVGCVSVRPTADQYPVIRVDAQHNNWQRENPESISPYQIRPTRGLELDMKELLIINTNVTTTKLGIMLLAPTIVETNGQKYHQTKMYVGSVDLKMSQYKCILDVDSLTGRDGRKDFRGFMHRDSLDLVITDPNQSTISRYPFGHVPGGRLLGIWSASIVVTTNEVLFRSR